MFHVGLKHSSEFHAFWIDQRKKRIAISLSAPACAYCLRAVARIGESKIKKDPVIKFDQMLATPACLRCEMPLYHRCMGSTHISLTYPRFQAETSDLHAIFADNGVRCTLRKPVMFHTD